jgi:hypothetical protein
VGQSHVRRNGAPQQSVWHPYFLSRRISGRDIRKDGLRVGKMIRCHRHGDDIAGENKDNKEIKILLSCVGTGKQHVVKLCNLVFRKQYSQAVQHIVQGTKFNIPSG